MHPSQARAAATRVDGVLMCVLKEVCGFTIPQREEGLPYTCPVEALAGASFQATLCSLPIKSRGPRHAAPGGAVRGGLGGRPGAGAPQLREEQGRRRR